MTIPLFKVDTGTAVIALPEDVQAEAYDWPGDLFTRRVWRVGRRLPEAPSLDRAVARDTRRAAALDLSGGGTIYSEATDELRFLGPWALSA